MIHFFSEFVQREITKNADELILSLCLKALNWQRLVSIGNESVWLNKLQIPRMRLPSYVGCLGGDVSIRTWDPVSRGPNRGCSCFNPILGTPTEYRKLLFPAPPMNQFTQFSIEQGEWKQGLEYHMFILWNIEVYIYSIMSIDSNSFLRYNVISCQRLISDSRISRSNHIKTWVSHRKQCYQMIRFAQ